MIWWFAEESLEQSSQSDRGSWIPRVFLLRLLPGYHGQKLQKQNLSKSILYCLLSLQLQTVEFNIFNTLHLWFLPCWLVWTPRLLPRYFHADVEAGVAGYYWLAFIQPFHALSPSMDATTLGVHKSMYVIRSFNLSLGKHNQLTSTDYSLTADPSEDGSVWVHWKTTISMERQVLSDFDAKPRGVDLPVPIDDLRLTGSSSRMMTSSSLGNDLVCGHQQWKLHWRSTRASL